MKWIRNWYKQIRCWNSVYEMKHVCRDIYIYIYPDGRALSVCSKCGHKEWGKSQPSYNR